MILSASAYGFAAANTVPDTMAGDGTGAISGYTVSAVTYVVETDASKLDYVTFNLDAAATTVKAKIDGNWYTAATTGSFGWKVDPGAGVVNVADIDSLQIVAAQ